MAGEGAFNKANPRLEVLTQLAAPRGSVPIFLTGHRKMGTDPGWLS
jgi:hypothetical protein